MNVYFVTFLNALAYGILTITLHYNNPLFPVFVALLE